MFDANWHKFAQNREMAMLLCNTGNYRLVECNQADHYWGNGVNINEHEVIRDIQQWPGQNKIGQVLMAVRNAMQHLPCPVPHPTPSPEEEEDE